MNKFITIILLMPFLTCCTLSTEERIENAINEQLARFPKSTLQDIYKNFYQDKFGAEHAAPSRERAQNYLDYELQNMTDADTAEFVEKIGWRNDYVRVPLALIKNDKLSADTLLNAFLESAQGNFSENIADEWAKEWTTIVNIIEQNNIKIDNFDADKIRIDSLLQQHPTMALHHSEAFREAYKPHYRIVKKEIFERIKYK